MIPDLLPQAVSCPAMLADSHFHRFRDLVLERFGLLFPDRRRNDLERGLQQAFAASTCADLDEYFEMLTDSRAGSAEMERLINALTIGETHFFRDAGQFDALYERVLPELIEKRRELRTLRIWSAGCASGEEPYSIAMMLRDLIPDVDDWAITILGTDVNTEALDRAGRSLYSDWAFRESRAKEWRERYFRRVERRYELSPEIRRMVTFSWLNLADDQYPSYESNTALMDLILCRNVTIYFDEPVVRQVADQLYDALTDGGWLVVGHSEPSLTIYRKFQAHHFPGTILYQRTGVETELPVDWDWLDAGLRAQRGPDPELPSLLTLEDLLPIQMPEISSEPMIARSVLPPETEPDPEPDPVEKAQELLEYGRSEDARDLLLEIVEEGPARAHVCELLGKAYANLGCWEESEHWCYRAVSNDRLCLGAYYTLALVLQHAGQLQRAIEAMRTVVYIDRTYVLGHYGLADLYRNNGQFAQALKSLDNARRLLASLPDDELIPDSGGTSVSRLRTAVIHQQLHWRSEAISRENT